ncbi:MAG: FtsX-like permease family protein [Coraliomargaritaceae bacterium]
MRTPIAWLNIIQHKKRTAAALAGIAFSILLIFMQLGFLGATRKNATVVYDLMDFDLLLCSNTFLTLTKAGSFERLALVQAQSSNAVEHASGVLVRNSLLLDESDQTEKRVLMLSINTQDPVFRDPNLALKTSRLRERASMLLDRRSIPGFGSWDVGEFRMVNDEALQIVGDYEMGIGILASTSMVVSHETTTLLGDGVPVTKYNLGLIKLKEGSDAVSVRKDLLARLPGTVRLMTREELNRKEQVFYLNTKPIGIMFRIGAAVAFIVGAVILYQILSSEISNRMGEYATLKAMGYSPAFVYIIGIQQGIIYSVLGFIPACILGMLLYNVLHGISGFHLWMPLGRALFVFVLALLMCSIASMFALGKIRNADPADLF